MSQWLKGVRNRVKLEGRGPLLRQKLVGHYQYYGISGNIKGLQTKIYHFYTLFKRRGGTPEEPDDGKPQVLFCEGVHSDPGANTPIGGGL